MRHSFRPASLLLALPAFAAMAACGSAGTGASSEDAESTSSDLMGQISFLNGTCTASEQAFVLDSAKRGRVIANSPAFEACMRSVMAGPTSLPNDVHLGRLVFGTEGPYEVCSGDPRPADPAGTVVALTRSNLGVAIGCQATGSGESAHAGVTTTPGANETMTYIETSLQGSISSGDQNYVAATVWHEAMHQHGYGHGSSGKAEDCGYSASAFSDDDDGWMRRHTVPYLVSACMVYLGDISDTCRASLSCKPDEVAIRSSFSSSASCACGHDPGWHALSPLAMKQVAVARDTAGELEAFGLATSGGVYVATQSAPNGASFGGWMSIPSSGLVQIDVGLNADGRLEVFGVGSNGALWHSWQNAARVWGGWQSLGRNDVKQVAVANSPDGTLNAFALVNGGSIVHTAQVGPNGGWAGAWDSLGGTALTAVRIGKNADGRPEVFAIGGNKALYHQWQWGGTTTWSGWQSLGRTDVDQVALANESDGTLTAYVRAGGAVYATSQSGPNGGWGGAWTSLWGSGLRDLSAGRGSDGRVRVFAVGGDSQAYETVESSPRAAFNSWTQVVGTSTYGAMAVGIDQAGRTNLVGLGTNGNVSQVAVP